MIRPCPKRRVIIHGGKHVAQVIFLDPVLYVGALRLGFGGDWEELGSIWGPIWAQEKPVFVDIRGASNINGWCCSRDIQVDIWAILTPVAA